MHGNLRMKKRMSLERALDLLQEDLARDTQEKSKANWLQGMCFETAGLEEPEGPRCTSFLIRRLIVISRSSSLSDWLGQAS